MTGLMLTNSTDANELLEFCLMERRLELSLEEGFRWFGHQTLGIIGYSCIY